MIAFKGKNLIKQILKYSTVCNCVKQLIKHISILYDNVTLYRVVVNKTISNHFCLLYIAMQWKELNQKIEWKIS